MSGYDASALNNPGTRLLVVGPNWLGDGIMAMPALQTLRERLHEEASITVAVKPGQADLWKMHPTPDKVLTLGGRNSEFPANVKKLRAERFTHALIIPHSFRSALSPTLARIPLRRGTAGQLRNLLMNDAVDLRPFAKHHQQWEVAAILLPGPLPDQLPSPRLHPPESDRDQARAWLTEYPSPHLGLIPGAARGPSKRWPGKRFLAVARAWIEHTGGSVTWLGTPEDLPLCQELSQSLPADHSQVLAGKTRLTGFAAVLEALDVVVANDSGGMHLAAAVGTPVVAIFGLTDPAKTGPLHKDAVVMQHAERVSRAIARDSEAARAALAAISAEEVIERVLAIPGSSA
ncbi:MAG: lipopolysaccharide heptosyltransferase II [Verrucomicrobia bacterium]|nr:lipopolysaccharide heptosyltransferase II [Verrucomicrobiota bacterium]MCH8510547.1 lipopolysaccharide heptosyltransferase II [Kiritimatiellia bacterium]